MAKYGQLSPADFFRADAAGLGRELALVVAWIAQTEMEDVPAKEFRRSAEKLRKIGLEFGLESVLGSALTDRIRKNRHRNKSKHLDHNGDGTRNVAEDVAKDVTTDVPGNVASRSRSRSRKIFSPEPVEQSSRKTPAVRIPPTWAPNDAHRVTARDRRLNLDWQAERFRDHAETNDRRCANWDAAFRNWLAKADPTREPRAPIGPRQTAATLTAVGIPEFRRVTP